MRIQRNTLQIVLSIVAVLVLFLALYAVLQLVGNDGGRDLAADGEEPTDLVTPEEPVVDDNPPPLVVTETSPTPPIDDDRGPVLDLTADEPEPGAGMFDDGPAATPTYADAGATDYWDQIYGGAGGDEPPLITRPPLDDDPAPTGNASRPPIEPTPLASGPRTYTVQQGDSFSSIARRELGDEKRWQALMRANPDVDPRRLRPGMTIILPTEAELTSGAQGRVGSTTTVERAIDPVRQYRVAEGDTLSDIALARYGKAFLWRDIYDANRATIGNDPGRLRPGTVLTIPPLPDGALGNR
jgi:nucleoid-associated protein YgaU